VTAIRRSLAPAFTLAALALTTLPAAGGSNGDDAAVDLRVVSRAASDALRAHVYDPGVLDTDGYRATEQDVFRLAGTAAGPAEFVAGFNRLWQDGPFSHVRMTQARQSAAEVASYLDSMKVGGGGATLEWRGDVAVLVVNTMMGQDTIEQIGEAYREIVGRKASALVIDLRHNDGGAFAVRPLVGHLIATELDTGFFLSQRWTTQHDDLPARDTVLGLEPWRGWSLTAFWHDVQENAVTRIAFEPAAPRFAGPVYVLTSHRTASAAELAVDAIRATGRAVIIGERTAGQMLSQKPYDLPGSMQLFLPIADYISLGSGRIEGVGIEPDVRVDPGAALDTALELVDKAARPPG